jgi:hypothetical protein
LRNGPPSARSSSPEDYPFTKPVLPPADPRPGRVRASVLTQTSAATTNSSAYPPSSSSATGPESPSPLSSPSVENFTQDPFDPHHLDADDVSYRLKLLVRNNYYLPPAHSKPALTSLPPPVIPAVPPKTSSPSFRDLFRVAAPTKTGSRSVPLSPESSPTNGLPNIPALSPRLPSLDSVPERKGRVMVIRERVEDLAQAAKEAEEDMRVRVQERAKAESENGARPAADPGRRDEAILLDPTDALDLPEYSFPLQGLGPDASVGAAALAEHLPPGTSSAFSEESEEDAWRRALLHEAVGLSMLHIPDKVSTPSSSSPTSSGPIGVPIQSRSTPSSPGGRKLKKSNKTPKSSRPNTADRRLESKTSSSSLELPAAVNGPRPSGKSKGIRFLPLPERAETPAAPAHPLPPPPRAKGALQNSTFSSHPPPPPRDSPFDFRADTKTVRKTLSTPLLSDSLQDHPLPPLPHHPPPRSRAMTLNPPLPSSPIPREEPQHRPPPLRAVESFASESVYSEEAIRDSNDGVPRQSFVSYDSNGTGARPSISFSHASPVSTSFGHRAHDRADGDSSTPQASSPVTSFVFPTNRSPPRRGHKPPSLTLPSGSFNDHGLRSAPPTESHSTSMLGRSADTLSVASNEYGSTIYVNQRSRALSNTSSTGNSSTTVMQFPNTSNTSIGYSSLDPSKPVTNTPSPNAQNFFTHFSGALTSNRFPSRQPQSAFEYLRHSFEDKSNVARVSPNDDVEALSADERSIPRKSDPVPRDPLLSRLDGLLSQHIEAERDTMKRIASHQRS